MMSIYLQFSHYSSISLVGEMHRLQERIEKFQLSYSSNLLSWVYRFGIEGDVMRFGEPRC